MGTTLDAGLIPAAKQMQDLNHHPLGINQNNPAPETNPKQALDSQGTVTDSQTNASQPEQTTSFHATLNKKLNKKSPPSKPEHKKDPTQKADDQASATPGHPLVATVLVEHTEGSQSKPETLSAPKTPVNPKPQHVTSGSASSTTLLKALSGEKSPTSLSPAKQTPTGPTSIPKPQAMPATQSGVIPTQTEAPASDKTSDKTTASASTKETVVQVPIPNPGTPAQGKDTAQSQTPGSATAPAIPSPADQGSTAHPRSFIQAVQTKMESAHQPSPSGKLLTNPASGHPATTATLPTDQAVETSQFKDVQSDQQARENPTAESNDTAATAEVQNNVKSMKSRDLAALSSGSGPKTQIETSASPNHVITPQHTASSPFQFQNTPEVTTPGTAAPLASSPHPARDLAQQILDSIHSTIQGQQKTVTIDLSPPELGRVTLRFQESHDGIQGELQINRAETRYDVERALPQIMHNLQSHGFPIRKIEVSVNLNNHQHADSQHQGQDARQQQSGGSQQQLSDQRWDQQQNPPGSRPSTQSRPTSSSRSPEGSLSSDDPTSYASFTRDSIDMLV